MGEMAGSLAHELNQPLTAIANYLNAAEQLLGREDVPRGAGGRAGAQGRRPGRPRRPDRRGGVPGQRTGARSPWPRSPAPAWCRKPSRSRAGGTARDGLVLRYDFDRAADRVMADRIQVQQVVLNLVRNAVGGHGRAAAPRTCDRQPGASNPAFLQFHVADTGPGISPQVADRLFQPFVTGKS